jgi:hypothetical protein
MGGGIGGLRRIAAVAAAALLGCAQQTGPCLLESHGACVRFTYDVSAIPDLQARVDRLLELTMAYWGLHSLSGWAVQFRDTSRYNCYLNMNNSGCTNFFDREISVHVLPTYGECFEAAPLLHELGHYTLGDPAHSDAEWHGVSRLFAPVVWDRPDAPAACVDRFKGITTGMWPVNYGSF